MRLSFLSWRIEIDETSRGSGGRWLDAPVNTGTHLPYFTPGWITGARSAPVPERFVNERLCEGQGADTMRTYDPMHGMVYRTMGAPTPIRTSPTTGTPAVTPLPSGYANASPRTFLGRSRQAGAA